VSIAGNLLPGAAFGLATAVAQLSTVAFCIEMLCLRFKRANASPPMTR
jgi:hypothetical protein